MLPIAPHEETSRLKADSTVDSRVCLLGTREAIDAVGTDRILREIEQGHWDELIHSGRTGPRGQSLPLVVLSGSWQRLYGSDNVNAPYANIAAALVARGADPFACDEEGRQALDQAFATGIADLALAWGKKVPSISTPLVDRLVSSIHGRHPPLPWVHYAALRGDMALLDACLELGLSVSQPSASGETPLFWAGNPAIVERLIAAGADPAHRNHAGVSAPAFWASHRKLAKSTIDPMSAMLPRNLGKSASRTDRVRDFFARAQQAGKAPLAQEMTRLDLTTNDVDDQGFGVLGNAGRRMWSPAASQSGTEVNKTTAWAEYLLAKPGLLADAPHKDRMMFWAGALWFGRYGHMELKKQMMEHEPGIVCPQFWRDVLAFEATLPLVGHRRDHAHPSEHAGEIILTQFEKGAVFTDRKEMIEVLGEVIFHSFGEKDQVFYRDGTIEKTMERMLPLLRKPQNADLLSSSWIWGLALATKPESKSSKLEKQLALVGFLLDHCPESAPSPTPAQEDIIQALIDVGRDDLSPSLLTTMEKWEISRQAPQATNRLRRARI